MKPFNLERALAGDPVVSAEKGLPITELTLFSGLKDERKLIGVYEEDLRSFYLDGTNLSWKITLKMAPKEKTYYLNIYKKEEILRPGERLFDSFEDAQKSADGRLLKTINFIIEE